MKKDNVLKKEFQRKDVERLRNLVKGKHGDRTTIGVGYTKKHEHYQEGDVWEEDGRTWTIKNGLKQNTTKLDSFKQMQSKLTECLELEELAFAENDEQVLKQVQEEFKQLTIIAEKFETECLFSGELDANNCFLEIVIFCPGFRVRSLSLKTFFVSV